MKYSSKFVTLLITLSLITYGCVNNEIQKNDNFSREISSIKFKITGNVPDSFKNDLLKVISKIESTFSKNLIIPQNLLITVPEKTDFAFFLSTGKYSEINIPYIWHDETENVELKSEEVLPLFAHEFGHYIHDINMMKISKSFRSDLLKLFKDDKEVPQKIEDLETKIKTLINNDGEITEVNRLKKLLKEYETRIREMKDIQISLGSYNEVFADLVPALIYDNPEIIVSLCKKKSDCAARSFTNNLTLSTYKTDDFHDSMPLARNFIWKKYKEGKYSKSEFAYIILSAFAIEYDKHISNDRERNRSLITTIDKITKNL